MSCIHCKAEIKPRMNVIVGRKMYGINEEVRRSELRTYFIQKKTWSSTLHNNYGRNWKRCSAANLSITP